MGDTCAKMSFVCTKFNLNTWCSETALCLLCGCYMATNNTWNTFKLHCNTLNTFINFLDSTDWPTNRHNWNTLKKFKLKYLKEIYFCFKYVLWFYINLFIYLMSILVVCDPHPLPTAPNNIVIKYYFLWTFPISNWFIRNLYYHIVVYLKFWMTRMMLSNTFGKSR